MTLKFSKSAQNLSQTPTPPTKKNLRYSDFATGTCRNLIYGSSLTTYSFAMCSKNIDSFIQVAGHTNYGEHNVPCILVSDDGLRVLKLIQQPPRGQKELIFYRQINGGFSKSKKTGDSEVKCSDSGVNSSSRRRLQKQNMPKKSELLFFYLLRRLFVDK